MSHKNSIDFIKSVLENMPAGWLGLTTHRLDIYNEDLAKTQFLDQLEKLNTPKSADTEVLKKGLKDLPTAFDYIRLGHPLSCILEWAIAKAKNLKEESVISFSSQTMPVLAILRKNLLENINTQILYKNELPQHFDAEVLKNVYGYKFELKKINTYEEVSSFNGSTIVLTEFAEAWNIELKSEIDFAISIDPELGSIVLVNGEKSVAYISEIQHVRRRETIAMTPRDCFTVLEGLVGKTPKTNDTGLNQKIKSLTVKTINDITNTSSDATIGSCGLSVQYAIMMGLIHDSLDKHPGKEIKFIVPPNCYGGTNDQARRVAACVANVEVVDLPVDGGQDMVTSIERVLDQVASVDAIPFIIGEIPTNPRVEVPDLVRLKDALGKDRKTKDGNSSIAPVFILDQTFCPNVKFLGEGDILSTVKTISYVSGSKFPSGGLCTAGYCVANEKAEALMEYIDKHLKLCGNEATAFQVETLSTEMPSMNQRIDDAYKNTLGFVNFIKETLPAAKINFVSEELASAGFTPSVFSLDLPVEGETAEQKETHKRDLNLKLIKLMISEIPHESKHCVSYGQLAGCYWTVPATSTQGTTKEGDKDYIVRVAISPKFDLDLHNKVFARFCEEYIK
ncbi:cystathionine beta-synthase [Halobacteriovorax marinus]|uniref:Cystathionine beta-synthase n=1 Tax=Halobacteriovorax marinus TaxID=97084 RepID=A0A1Y5F520_9BACT|nr:cystathionine beta-synthase [Halobacteriovorax marinus]